MPNSFASTSAQDLLDALIDFRQIVEQRGLKTSDFFRDSGRFKALMQDLRPDMKNETRIISALIDEGFLVRLCDADADERVWISGQINAWLDSFGLKVEDAQTYSDVLLAFCNGETNVWIEAPHKEQARNEPQADFGASQVPGNASPSANASSPGASRWASNNYLLSFALLVLAAAIFYFGTAMARNSGLVVSVPEPSVTPAVAHSVTSSPEPKVMPTASKSTVSSPEPSVTPAVAQIIASSPEPTVTPAVVQNIAPSPEPAVTPVVAQSVASSASSLRTVYVDKQVGEIFDFGRYPQGANGEIEPITWRVLQREADHLLVIAEQGLDCKRFNEELCAIMPWADCTLRRWLNSEFYDKAFNEKERECIKKYWLLSNVGPNTEDRVFLVDITAVEWKNVEVRLAKPTKYATKNGAHTNTLGYCHWWLRSRGGVANKAAYVNADGEVSGEGDYVNQDHYAIRPALHLAL